MTGSWKQLDATGRLLLSINAVLALLVYVEMDLTPLESLASAAAMPSPHLPSMVPREREAAFTMPPLEEYAEIVARPPFSQTRRPPPRAAAESAAQPIAFALVGIVLVGNDRRVLVEHGDPPRLTRLGEGQEIEGWTIKAILRDRILMSRSEIHAELKLKDRPQNKTVKARSGKGREAQSLQEGRRSPDGREQPAVRSPGAFPPVAEDQPPVSADQAAAEQSPAASSEPARVSSGLHRRRHQMMPATH